MSVSAIRQTESAACIAVFPLPWIFFTFRSPQSIESSSLCYTLYGRFSLAICFIPGGTSGKEPACPCRRQKRHWFDPQVGRISWSRKWQRTPVFLLENPVDRGAWRATGLRIAKRWPRRKWQHARSEYESIPIHLTSLLPPVVFILLFSTSVLLFLLCKFTHLCHFLESTYIS